MREREREREKERERERKEESQRERTGSDISNLLKQWQTYRLMVAIK